MIVIQRQPAQARSSRQLRAAIYARVSTPKQKSIPQQIAVCRERCDSLGYNLRYILAEEGFSAKNTGRPKLLHLLQLCADGKIDVIIVWKLDRLVRSLTDLVNTHKLLENWGVHLHSVTEQFDTSSAFGRFNFRNIASAAELERELIAERARLGKMAQAIAGRWPTQRPPLGYDLGHDRRLKVNAAEAAVVKRIFSWYTEDALALTEISRRLGAEGLMTREERTFSPGAVQSIVNNSLYVGRLAILGVLHDRPDLRIVSEETWGSAQRRRGQRVKCAGSESRREAALDAVLDAYLSELREQDDSSFGPE